MRIEGKKPSPTNLADIVSSMDDGFSDDVGVPPESAVTAGSAITSPMREATAKYAEKRERRSRKALVLPPEDPADTPASEDPPVFVHGKPVIEHNVPIPPHGNVGAVRYPFRDMKAGDSFFVKQEPGESRAKLSARVRSASAQFRRRATGEVVSFTTRMEKTGIRVWRIS